MASNRTLDGPTISNITNKEKEITGEPCPVKGGPTAQAQKHSGEPITSETVSAVADGEKKVVGGDGPRAGGPAAYVQGLAIAAVVQRPRALLQFIADFITIPALQSQHTGKLDGSTISAIADAEKRITGKNDVVKGGPTAQAQKHAGEPINSLNLHDITEGEKAITHQATVVKGGPTATAQSELSKSRKQANGSDRA
ncbi:hypothetical protein SLS62_010121 [Diatrype stigma]|uniref:SMP domain-containing protein n=1 Tax=Diatrype stigma TaxID=117547 RepID=A0AAN9UDP1_9PEZI